MTTPTLYRKRFIPNEIIPLKDDVIVVHKDDLMITAWTTLHPRNDIAKGISAYYLKEGFKVSKVFDKNNNLVYWYCDIIKTKEDNANNSIIFEDLLVDVIIYKDGSIKVLDLDELADALEHNLIDQKETLYALRTLDQLLSIIYQGNFSTLQDPINQISLHYCSNI